MMLIFPSGKINLGLNITEKRPNGCHNLEIVFCSIPIEDALEINLLHEGSRKYYLHQAGIEIAGEAESSLVVKAYKLLDELLNLPPMDTHLFKHIPSGAGLGRGSTDTIFMLKLLNEKFNLGLSTESMEDYTSRSGAGCVFFIWNAPTYVEGIDDVFSPVLLLLKGFRLQLVKPDTFVFTRDTFSQVRPHCPGRPLKETIQLPVEEQRNCMVNGFEESASPQLLAIKEIKEEMYRQGAAYISVNDPSSPVYGIFKPNVSLPDIDFGKKVFIYEGKLVV